MVVHHYMVMMLGSLGMNTEGSLLNFELQIILLAPNILHHSNIPFSRNIFSLFFSPQQVSAKRKFLTKMNKISYLALGMVAFATIMTSSAALTDDSESHKIKTDVIGMLRGKINSIANGRLLKKEKGGGNGGSGGVVVEATCGDGYGKECCKYRGNTRYCLEGFGCDASSSTCTYSDAPSVLPLCYPAGTTDFCATEGTECSFGFEDTSDPDCNYENKTSGASCSFGFDETSGEIIEGVQDYCPPSCGPEDFPIPENDACCGEDKDGDKVIEATYCY